MPETRQYGSNSFDEMTERMRRAGWESWQIADELYLIHSAQTTNKQMLDTYKATGHFVDENPADTANLRLASAQFEYFNPPKSKQVLDAEKAAAQEAPEAQETSTQIDPSKLTDEEIMALVNAEAEAKLKELAAQAKQSPTATPEQPSFTNDIKRAQGIAQALNSTAHAHAQGFRMS